MIFNRLKVLLVIFLGLLNFYEAQANTVMKKHVVYVYSDTGVSKEALTQTLHSLQASLGAPYQVKTILAKEVIANTWQKDALIFVMPGGADVPYHEKLKGLGNQHIKDFVFQGGSYLGLCAGAYYAASRIEFDKGGPLAVLADRELSFYPGIAVGPVLAKYFYQSNKGARAALIKTSVENLGALNVFYNGGGTFSHVTNYSDVRVIASYHNSMPAIIAIPYGKGRVILSGVHFEYSPFSKEMQDKNLLPIMQKLKKTNSKRLLLLKAILQYLLSPQRF